MYNLNKNKFNKAPQDKPSEFDIKAAAKIFKIKNVGRNKLYKIMREMGLLNAHNWPAKQFIDDGLLRGEIIYHNGGGSKPKAYILGEEGLEFVKSKAEEYIENPEEATKNVIKPEIEIDYGTSRDI